MCIDIGLQWIKVSLRGYGSESPTGTTFFELLALEPRLMMKASPSNSVWQSANVELFVVHMQELQGFSEPTEEFSGRVEQGFRKWALWLNLQPIESFARWRDLGRKVDIFIGGWLLNEQIDLSLPAVFLAACGRLGLPIEICTND